MKRLGDGTEESHRRMQAAVDELWPYAHELFAADPAARSTAATPGDAGARLRRPSTPCWPRRR